jgi:hypothetical protein
MDEFHEPPSPPLDPSLFPPGEPIDGYELEGSSRCASVPLLSALLVADRTILAPEFFAHELAQALVDCGYGLLSWEQPNPGSDTGDDYEARATVELLEDGGREVVVVLDSRGYHVCYFSASLAVG